MSGHSYYLTGLTSFDIFTTEWLSILRNYPYGDFRLLLLASRFLLAKCATRLFTYAYGPFGFCILPTLHMETSASRKHHHLAQTGGS